MNKQFLPTVFVCFVLQRKSETVHTGFSMHGFCKAMRKREITAKFKFAKNIGENEKNRYHIEATILPCPILIPEGRSALLLVIIITYRTPFVNTLFPRKHVKHFLCFLCTMHII